MKKTLRKFAAASALLAFCLAGASPASADGETIIAKRKVYTYESAGGKQMGWIDPGDNVIVVTLHADDWCYGSYPTSNGRRTRWFKYSEVAGTTLADGWYRIASAANTGLCADIANFGTQNGANAIIYNAHDGNNQKFYIQNRGGGYFSIRAGHVDKYLDVAGGSSANGTNVQLHQWNGTNAQLWRAIDGGNGTVYLESKLRLGYYLDCGATRIEPDANIQMWNGGSVPWHRWKLSGTGAPGGTAPAPAPQAANANISNAVARDGYRYPMGKRTRFVDNTGEGIPHDYICSEGLPVYAIKPGTVYYYQVMGTYGNYGYSTVSYGNVAYLDCGNVVGVYAHLNRFADGVALRYASKNTKGSTYKKCKNYGKVYLGKKQVAAGEVIGYVGNVGNSSTPHLHFEFWDNVVIQNAQSGSAKIVQSSVGRKYRINPNQWFDL